MTSSPQTSDRDQQDLRWMERALDIASRVRLRTSPNPWVGCVLVTAAGDPFDGATEPPGGRHAEIVALDAARRAGAEVRGATMYTTLEPCSHHGRTGPCTEAIVEAGVSRLVSALADPDPQVNGAGFDVLRHSGVAVEIGIGDEAASEQLQPYLHHRRTGRPFVVLKTACTLDGRTAAPDGSSQWITGDEARRAVHRLRAESDAIVVGAGTVRSDDPSLTTRLVDGPSPRRVVLGTAPPSARVHPCLEWNGDLGELLDTLGGDGVLQLMVEGGAKVAASFHRQDLVDRYVFHMAPALMGGDGAPVFDGRGASTMMDLWRGRVRSTRALGDDLEIVLDRSVTSPLTNTRT
ncbi:MAG: bifunctional diaminohydroxyphosphoribosylaminopyrimidine deaminase/5-amino-6-(5-phosphoribosylamino)uracil reductase RibD [Actinomycetota bacterium]